MNPTALILHAPGTNRDRDAAQAIELAGGNAEIVHINQLRSGERRWQDYQMLVVPGGFSYADALGAGRLLALDLTQYFAGEVAEFVASGKPAIGICNGFQALVKSGILPDPARRAEAPSATLTHNANGRFECRWVHLQPVSQKCIWTRGIGKVISCPVAHGEGNFTVTGPLVLSELTMHDQVALVYARQDGVRALGAYPDNPNGSAGDIAGICSPGGTVLGLMPHPENHIFPYQNPDPTGSDFAVSGLVIFSNGLAYARQL
jgi:phosphoribosylformylglycinamidine synthase subunit PurQ / glutaminase